MIQNKRNSLEKFIHDQMIGPGGCNNRYDYICEENGNVSDVINTTPGSLYSTAILFPKKRVSVATPTDVLNEENDEAAEDIQSEESGVDVDIEEKVGALSQSEEDDLYSLSQRFPNSIGISCCLDAESSIIVPDDLKVTVSGRYYTKVKDEHFNCIVIRPEITYSEIELFYNKNKELQPYFTLDSKGIRITNTLKKQEEYLKAKQILLGIDLQECKEIAKIGAESFDPIYETNKPEYRYLKSYKEKLWSKLRQIKDDVYLNDSEKSIILDRIKSVEKYQTIISHFDDALNICNSRSFGYWTGYDFCHVVDLSMLSFDTSNRKTIYSPKANPSLKNIVTYTVEDESGEINASLSVWVQLTISPLEPNKRYFKIQLENTSDPFEEDSKQYFSIVTEKVNKRCFFGVEVKIESDKLCPYKELGQGGNVDSDIARLNYLYRSIRDYGIGHMCSVVWGEDISGKWVKSEFIPTYETPDVEPTPRDKHAEYVTSGDKYVPKEFLTNSRALEFKWLSKFSSATNQEVISQLYGFVDTYNKWIEQLKVQSDRSQFADLNISLCEQDYHRMRSNIELLLEGNDQNIESFRMMNSAMFIQLWHSKNSTLEETDYQFYVNTSDHIFGSNPATWRPFQLAFILLNLDGVIQRPDDPMWDARNELVDLVWFPTGGGKTEAYLGIIALTIINRRVTADSIEHGGTTAIMRYTLRLLATQQFQRAMRVILSLEQLRKWDNEKLGDEPISIGLYVGRDSLPNKAIELLEECKRWSNINNNKRAESKIPLDRCPWCGKDLEFRNIKSDSNPAIEFLCSNINCTFSDSLPIKLCDEDIYTTPPTLLFGTVDKFAMIGHNVSTDSKKHNNDSRRIFGGGDLTNLPPSLIIQDELHLLLGPLGSAVSLFEAAIDQLCSTEKVLEGGKKLVVRPKIISSTATTRNTELQVRALYDRQVNIFPKSGLDYDDSFFAFYKREKVDGEVRYISKRKYIGILPMGRTQMTTQMRLIATIFVHRALFENEYNNRLDDDKVAEAMDFYHSTISYLTVLKRSEKPMPSSILSLQNIHEGYLSVLPDKAICLSVTM
ncbi:MAG: helicase, partial [bacterium]